jgi:hypothetical protein
MPALGFAGFKGHARGRGKWPDEFVQDRRDRRVEANATDPVVAPTQKLEGNDLLGSAEKEAAVWGERLEVAGVSACDGREVRVSHAGKTAVLARDGTLSSALAGTPLAGVWDLASPMTPAEAAKPQSRPKELRALVTLRCRQEAR